METRSRADLEQLIKARRRELADKQQRLEQLQNQRVARTGADSRPPVNAEELLKDVIREIEAPIIDAAPPLRKKSSERMSTTSPPLARPAAVRRRPLLAGLHQALTKEVEELNILPSTTDTVDKSCQVASLVVEESDREVDSAVSSEDESAREESKTPKMKVMDVESPTTGAESPPPRQWVQPDIKVLPEKEQTALLADRGFTAFFDVASKRLEKALRGAETFREFGGVTGEQPLGEQAMKLGTIYVDPKWSSGRPVFNIRPHPMYREYLLGAYGEKETATLADADGCVLVWNLALRERPEYAFAAQAPVTNALFNPFSPNLILGGTSVGQILLWDSRAMTRPVQRTGLSSRGHQLPIYGLEMAGSAHANSLISMDSEGRLCQWSTAMLTAPTESADLTKPSQEKTSRQSQNRICPLCMALPSSESFVVTVGTEEGHILEAQTGSNSTGQTEMIHDPGSAHEAPVTSLQWHPPPVEGGASQTDLLLSTGMDWHVCVWSPKMGPKVPLITLEAYEECVFAAKWSPTHSALLAACDVRGNLDLWDLSKSVDSPLLRTVSDDPVTALGWMGGGSRLMAATISGRIQAYTVAAEFQTNKDEEVWLDRVQLLSSTAQPKEP